MSRAIKARNGERNGRAMAIRLRFRIHAARRMSILFVTHDVEEAVVLADRIVMMSARPGRVRRSVDVSLPQPRLGTEGAAALTAELRASLEAEPAEQVHGR